MLSDLIKEGYGEKEDYNCAEKLLSAANITYDLGLDKEAIKLSSGFGSGMGIEDKCGALTAAIMVLGKLFIKERAHESTRIKELAAELFDNYKREMLSIDCAPLKAQYRTEEIKCRYVIQKAAEVLEIIIEREKCQPEISVLSPNN